MATKHYGTTAVESDAIDSLKCKQIVKTVIDFGITESQKLKMIYLLALELENRDYLQEITGMVKRLESGGAKSALITEV